MTYEHLCPVPPIHLRPAGTIWICPDCGMEWDRRGMRHQRSGGLCQCGQGLQGAEQVCQCLRPATQEDMLCDPCREDEICVARRKRAAKREAT